MEDRVEDRVEEAARVEEDRVEEAARVEDHRMEDRVEEQQEAIIAMLEMDIREMPIRGFTRIPTHLRTVGCAGRNPRACFRQSMTTTSQARIA